MRFNINYVLEQGRKTFNVQKVFFFWIVMPGKILEQKG